MLSVYVIDRYILWTYHLSYKYNNQFLQCNVPHLYSKTCVSGKVWLPPCQGPRLWSGVNLWIVLFLYLIEIEPVYALPTTSSSPVTVSVTAGTLSQSQYTLLCFNILFTFILFIQKPNLVTDVILVWMLHFSKAEEACDTNEWNETDTATSSHIWQKTA